MLDMLQVVFPDVGDSIFSFEREQTASVELCFVID